jgi:hypothetical protein
MAPSSVESVRIVNMTIHLNALPTLKIRGNVGYLHAQIYNDCVVL